MIIHIDTSHVEKLIADADKVLTEQEAEEVLIKFIELEKVLEAAHKDIKERLLKKAQEINPNFKSFSGDQVKIIMKPIGAKYYVREEDIDLAPDVLYKTDASVRVPNLSIDKIVKLLESVSLQVNSKKTKTGNELSIKRVVDSKAVDKWIKEHRALPSGIIEPIRDTSLTWSEKGENKDE